MVTEQCSVCRFALALESKPGLFRCRRYAPRPQPIMEDDINDIEWVWFIVLGTDWCGEFDERRPPH